MVVKVLNYLFHHTKKYKTYSTLGCPGVGVLVFQVLFIIKSIKRELKIKPIYDCQCDERLKPKDDEST